ncbi:hypothetical protein SNE40_001897 [Patella caerulea]|uniref:alpha-L-fucosidase n=2 Tax=Patella caerulea TaxID=87958 RepID=A0AAN8Q281_PATCE
MGCQIYIFLTLTLGIIVLFVDCVRYEPTWKSLDSRPLPEWYDQSKIGIFIHWGVFSVPSFGSEWFWYYWKGSKIKSFEMFMEKNYPPGFTYADFASQFHAEFYNPKKWVDIFKASGARYIVQVTKHHEGFTSWPSNHSFNWNAMAVGPKRDLVGELAAAVRSNSDLHYGVYHSLFEWFNPLYNMDKAANYTTHVYQQTKSSPELYELVKRYKPDIVWSDGPMGADSNYWKSKEFLSWLYNDSPVKDRVVVNDRWGSETGCKHGGYYTCSDRYNPGTLQKKKWENCMTLDLYSWGYRRRAKINDIIKIEDLIATLVETVSCGGNILINVGPTSSGIIVPIFEERLRQMGQWLTVNGEAIYSSKPWSYQNDTLTPKVWYTSQNTSQGLSKKIVYALVLQWPKDNILVLKSPIASKNTTVSLVGYPGTFPFSRLSNQGISIEIPVISFNQMPCSWAWTFKLTNIVN